MRYATASSNELLQWGIDELDLREADVKLRLTADCARREQLRAKEIGATILQANGLCRDAIAFLRRKGMRA